ncbi:MAG: aldo/keto reductase, partial [Candidatus Eremiobacterota bacterium]
GKTGLEVSPLGFGCYRVDDRAPLHRRSLELALQAGVNLVDTSTNYGDGHSERLVGQVLAGREAVVVSKIGYLQGSNLALARSRNFPEMVHYSHGCWHCIHPEFLEDQLTRSLERLGRLDVCLLHNPEYFLMDAAKRGQGGQDPEFYRRLGQAFEYFEAQVQAGRIGWYGVSSNTVAEDGPESTSLAEMLRVAGPHFGVLQLPFNLMETEPALNRKHGGRSVLELAAEANLGVLVNRPLNAFVGSDLVRLADPEPVPGTGRSDQDLLRIAPEAWQADLRWLLDNTPPLPRLRELQVQLQGLDPEIITELRHRASLVNQRQADAVRERCHFGREGSLSQLALWTVASVPGVTSVLVGMRRPEYVEDACAVLDWEPHPDPLSLLEASP